MVAPVKRLAEVSWLDVVVSAPDAVPVNVADAETRPVLLVVTVTSLETPALSPVTVTRPVDEISALPPLEAEMLHVYEESKFDTCALNPVAVDVVTQNVGRSGASNELPLTVAAPFSNPLREVVAETIALEPTSMPRTVIRPPEPSEICAF